MATVSDYQTMHGKTIIDDATASLGANAVGLFTTRAWNIYSLDPTTEATTATEDQKEMVALTSLIKMIGSYMDQVRATQGAVQRVKLGSDGNPDITFFDRANTMVTYKKGLYTQVGWLQRKLGYVPFYDPSVLDIPFKIARVDMESDEVTDGETTEGIV